MTDPQIDRLDIARFGGAVTQWMVLGTVNNTAGVTFSDDYMDADLNEAADLDVFQPFPTLDTPKLGTCNVVGTRVTWVSGDLFNVNWAPGTAIKIAGIDRILYARPYSTTVLEIVEGMPNQAGAVFEVKSGTLLSQPLPCLWGPYDNRLLACGDAYQPGVLFYTKGNDPDSASESGWIEVTSPSEALMNGCMFDGYAWVFSSERLFRIYPSTSAVISPTEIAATGGISLIYSIVEVPNSKGLFARWAMAVGPRIYFLGRDGIYETVGAEPRSLTERDLYMLFPHEGQVGTSVTLGGQTITPPDMSHPESLRLHYYDGHLYFDYVDTLGARKSLVYNTVLGVWSVDTYSFGAVTHYGEEGANVHSLLVGAANGYLFQAGGSQDNGMDFASEVRMALVSDLDDFLHLGEAVIGVMADDDFSFIVRADGTDHTHTVVPTVPGAYEKVYVRLQAIKGKFFEFSLTSAKPFRLFMRDCKVEMKPWGVAGGYADFLPFADLHRETPIGVQT
jgi:hypothetical protein